jgi:regulator of RNase E activity RraA
MLACFDSEASSRRWLDVASRRNRQRTGDVIVAGGRNPRRAGAGTRQKTGAPNCPIEFRVVCLRPGDPAFGYTDGMVIIGQDCAEGVCMPALKRRENERIMIENLRKGKTILELPGLGGAE